MVANPERFIQYNKNIVQDIFKKKEEYHLAQVKWSGLSEQKKEMS